MTSRALYSLLIALVVAASCGKNVSSSGIPRKVTDITTADIPAADLAARDKWLRLTEYFGMGNNEAASTDALKVSLATPPTIYQPTHERYNTLRTNVATKVLGNALTTQCAEIVGITIGSTAKKLNATGTALEDLSVGGSALAKVYTLKYKLYNADGSKGATRTGLVTIPTNVAAYPLMVYAHGGASGLDYQGVAELFGAGQAQNIILAPTFPGEPLCTAVDYANTSCTSTPLAAAVGEQSVWDGDVLEFLGMHNCIASHLDSTEFFAELDGTTLEPLSNSTISNPWAQKLKTIATTVVTQTLGGLGNTAQIKTPYTVALGTSRGARVAQLAVSYAGIFAADLAGLASNASKIKEAATAAQINFRPMFPSALGVAFPPFTETIGQTRLALEAIIKGTVAGTVFYRLPTVPQLAKLFSRFENGANDSLTLEQTATELGARDMLLMTQFSGAALRDWGETSGLAQKPGQLLVLHGVADQIVPYLQSIVAFNTYKGVNAAIVQNNTANPSQTLPGFRYNVMAFQPPESFYKDGVFQGTDYNHGAVPSFVTATLASLSADQSAIVNGTATGDGTLNATSAGVSSALITAFKASAGNPTGDAATAIETAYSTANVKAVLYGINSPRNDAYGETAADLGHHTDPSSLYNLTPITALSIWLGSLAATQTQSVF